MNDAIALAADIVSGATTPHDALTAALDRADAWNPHLNCLVHRDDDFARRIIDEGLPDGPLRGVPFLIKDIGCETPDFPVTGGSRISSAPRYPLHATVYARLRAAGLVPFARTTCPEAAIGPATEAALYGGPTRNPWNLGHTSGGSSGGAASAVAAGIVAAAHASDGGGSIRIPASCCGLVGHKPSRALVPDGPYAGEGWGGMATDGVVSRTVRDSALLYDILFGADLGDPYFGPPLSATLSQAVTAPPTRLRVALCTTTFEGLPIHSECRDAVEAAGSLLEGLGHYVEEGRPAADHRGMIDAWTRIVACGTASWVRTVEAARGEPLRDRLELVARGACEMADTLSGADYLDAINAVHAFGREMASYFAEGPDILVSPVLAEPPAKVGRFSHARNDFTDFQTYRTGEGGIYEYSPFAPAFNASGQPAISLPLHWTADGLPVGVQFAAATGQDPLLFSLAAQIEAAAPWHHRAPNMP